MFSRSSKPFAVSLAALLASSALVACGEDDDTVVQDAEEEGFAAEVAILGEPVTVQAEVQEIVGPNVFTVGDGPTLVVGADMTEALEEGDDVQVTGTVREFVIVDVEETVGVDFEEDEENFVVEYEQELAIVADDVSTVP